MITEVWSHVCYKMNIGNGINYFLCCTAYLCVKLRNGTACFCGRLRPFPVRIVLVWIRSGLDLKAHNMCPNPPLDQSTMDINLSAVDRKSVRYCTFKTLENLMFADSGIFTIYTCKMRMHVGTPKIG